MRIVNGMIKNVATLFVGLTSADMRQLLNRQPMTIPTHIEVPEERTDFQILLFGGETEESLNEQVEQLGATIYNADEGRRN